MFSTTVLVCVDIIICVMGQRNLKSDQAELETDGTFGGFPSAESLETSAAMNQCHRHNHLTRNETYLMTVWRRLMAGGDTLLKDGLNDDSFYVSEKRSSAALSGMCLTTLIHSCDLGDEFIHWFFFPPCLLQFNHRLSHQKAHRNLKHYISFIQTLCPSLAHHMLPISQLISQYY